MGSDENRDFPVSLLDIWLLHGGLKVHTLHVVYFDITVLSSFSSSRDKVPVPSLVLCDTRFEGGVTEASHYIACYGRKSRLSIPLLLSCVGPQFLLWCLSESCLYC